MAEKIYMGATIGLDGEKEFKKAVSSINSDARVLASEMKKVTSAYNENGNSLEALQKKDIVLNKQLDAQKKKVETLRSALKNAQDTYGENDTRVDKWKISLNNAEAQMSKLDSELKTNDRYMDEAKRSTDKTATSIDKFGKEVKTTEGKTSMFGDVLKANLTTAAIVGGIKTLASEARQLGEALKGCATDAMTYADDMLTLSAQTGISTDKLQRYNYMSELVDVSVETITGSMKKNIKSMDNASQGSERYVNAYKKLGVSVTDSNGKLRDSESVYWDVIDALGSMQNSTERDATSMQLFGKSAQDLNPMIQRGADGMRKLGDEASSMGAVMSGDALSALGGADDASQRLTQSMEILKRNIGQKLAPTIMDISERFTNFAQDNKEEISEFVDNGLNKLIDGLVFLKNNWMQVSAAAGAFVTTIVTAKVLGFVGSTIEAVNNLRTSINAAKGAQTALNTAQTASPIGIILAMVAAVGSLAFAYVSAAQKAEEARRKESVLTNEQKKLNQEIENTYKASSEMKKSMDESNKSIDDQYTGVQTLVSQLDKIVDKNGKIKKGYQDRANVIANELKNSYGIEVEIVNGTIKNNEKLRKNINKLIATKKAEALLENNKDEYIKSLMEKGKAEETYNKAKKQSKDLEEKLAEAANNRQKAQDDLLNKATHGRNGNDRYYSDILDEQKKKEEALQKSVDKQNIKYKEAATAYYTYSDNIKNYETLQKESINGSTKAVSKATDKYIKNCGRAGAKGAQEFAAHKKEYETAGTENADAISKPSEKLVEKMGLLGENAGKSFISGLKGPIKDPKSREDLKTTLRSIEENFRKTLKINSPSKVFKALGGSIGEGFQLGSVNSMKSANRAIQKEVNDTTRIHANASSVGVSKSGKSVATSQQAPSDIVDAISGAMSGDLNITLTLDGKSVFESNYKEFRKRKTADPTLSLA